jgi:hypothetical protein
VGMFELLDRLFCRSSDDSIRLDRKSEFDQRVLGDDRQMGGVFGRIAAQEIAYRIARARRRNRNGNGSGDRCGLNCASRRLGQDRRAFDGRRCGPRRRLDRHGRRPGEREKRRRVALFLHQKRIDDDPGEDRGQSRARDRAGRPRQQRPNDSPDQAFAACARRAPRRAGKNGIVPRTSERFRQFFSLLLRDAMASHARTEKARFGSG